MNATKKCELCETQLEFTNEDGTRFEFTKHDAAFCRDMTLGRIRLLGKMLFESNIENERVHRAHVAFRGDVAHAIREYVSRAHQALDELAKGIS